jgi:hypothetical protein
MDSYVERQSIEVMRVLADMKSGGPAQAMQRLESKLPSLKGRRFYGVFRLLPDGEEYYACVEKTPTDDPSVMGLDMGEVPGGLYVRRKIFDWEKVISEGKLGSIFQQMVGYYELDQERPEIEYYRSMSELHLLLPVLNRLRAPSA